MSESSRSQHGSSIKNISQIRTNTKSVRSHFGPKTGKTGFTMKLKKISDQSESPKTYQCRQLKLCSAVKFFFSSNGKNFTFHRKKLLGGLALLEHMYFQLKHVRELPKHVATNGHRMPDVIASTGLQANRKILMPFQLTQPAPSTRQITQRLLYF